VGTVELFKPRGSILPRPAPKRARYRLAVPAVAMVICLAGGCGRPNQANILLRKQNQTLEQRLADLDRRHAADQATIRSLEASATTVPVLPEQRIAQLFTVAGLSFGRLTGGVDLDPGKPGDEGLKVYVVPVDQHGDALKAAGTFRVEAFALSDAERPLVGIWEFPLSEAQQNWYGQSLLYTYILTCPWQQVIPTGHTLTIRVTFTDALTGRTFTAQRQVSVNPPPPTAQTRPSPDS
jgi:hypothetical protein